MKKVSIIIPCYNVESTIDTCMDSILRQTIGIENMEIILVNDASCDDSLNRMLIWEQKFPDSVMVINCEENGKPGQARNIGMQYASGEYIGFMDDDDILETDMFAFLYEMAAKNQCDLAICQIVQEETYTPIPLSDHDTGLIEILTIRNSEERLAFLKRDTNMSSCNKLYRKDMLLDNRLLFPTGMIYEDIFFSSLVKHYCQKVCFTTRILYHHLLNSTSISRNISKTDRICYIQIHMLLIEELRNRGLYETFAKWYEEQFVISYITFVLNYEKLFGIMEASLFQMIKDTVWELFPSFSTIPAVDKLLHNPATSPAIKRVLLLQLGEREFS